jgi:hypothetical protein
MPTKLRSEENELPAHDGSVREGRNCFCQAYAMLRLRLAVKYGIEYPRL